jgi:hypothetical protein
MTQRMQTLRRARPFISAALCLSALAACGGSSSDGAPDGGAPSTGGAAGEGVGGGGAGGPRGEGGATLAASPTYYQDVAPLLSRACNACHIEGGIAPFALDTYELASQNAAAVRAATASHEMPPWPPGPSSPALLHDRALSQQEIDLLAAWADAGAPAGDPAAKAPLVPPETVDIGPVALAVDTGVDYVPDATLTDDYRCFLVELGTNEDHVATGYRITPGNRKTVHHVITSLFPAENLAAFRALDAETEAPGWPCTGGISSGVDSDDEMLMSVGSLGSWVPGVSAVQFPAGTGAAVPAGSFAVMQMHYNLAGGTDPDRTRLEVAFAAPEQAAALQIMRGLPLVQRQLTIAAGAAGVVATRSATARQWARNRFFPDGDAYVVAVGGHMHTIGRQFTIERTDAAGTTTLLDIPDWDFHWQGSYQLERPLVVRADDVLTIRCIYDNDGTREGHEGGTPHDVTWGEGTEDEMCLGSLGVVDNAPLGPPQGAPDRPPRSAGRGPRRGRAGVPSRASRALRDRALRSARKLIRSTLGPWPAARGRREFRSARVPYAE